METEEALFSVSFFILIEHKIFQSIDEVPELWDEMVAHDVLLQIAYLRALEKSSPENINPFYVCVYKNNTLVGVALVQHVKLYLKDMFRDTKVSCIKTLIQDTITRTLKGNILVIGNLTHTGQHGVAFNSNFILKDAFYNQLFKAISEIECIVKQSSNKTIRLIMLKDFFEGDTVIDEDVFQKEKLQRTNVQPNMILDVWNDWDCNADYVTCMKKKYRDRYKRAKKKLNDIVCKEMSFEDLNTHAKTMHQLYLNVSDNARFNTFKLPEQHFSTYKNHLKENFKVFGYYLEDKLIGFCSLILNNKQLETYFLGYAIEHQSPNQLYLNMLYDMAKYGIDNGFNSIVYARTAMEIKSSIGAKPKPMRIYLKHTNPILNRLLKPLFRLMNPTKDWQERHPFS